jgi:hypothetical protein
MVHTMSRAQRRVAFLECATRMFDALEDWYDTHPDASFGEIEAEARRQRRELMGQALTILINGRDRGFQLEAPRCQKCGQAMEFQRYRGWTIYGLEGDTRLERAYYVCPDCAGETLCPLDRKLRLREDHWSEGAARVATRQGLQAKSFDLAAEAYDDAVGGSISSDSVRRITQGWGKAVEAQRHAEAERANAPAQVGEGPRDRRIAEMEPIRGQANLSTDGAMVLVRSEGWKEVKLTAVSEVRVRAAEEGAARESRSSRREQDPLVELSGHSYQAGLWDADTMALHQYTEGLRRGIDRCPRLSSVNDGAPWIERITYTNFPEAEQVVDWSHASGRLWQVRDAIFGKGTSQGKEWVEGQLDLLWRGQVAEVVTALDDLALEQERYPPEVRQAPGYFRSNQMRMRYDYFREAGYPIGSGTVESAANNVVHHRMRRPGRGWQRDNARAMLAGLSELHSGRFDRAWQATLPLAA